MKKELTWLEVAEALKESCGIQMVDAEVDGGRDRFFICPECGEPILEEDFPSFDAENCVCPVCEEPYYDLF